MRRPVRPGLEPQTVEPNVSLGEGGVGAAARRVGVGGLWMARRDQGLGVIRRHFERTNEVRDSCTTDIAPRAGARPDRAAGLRIEPLLM